jgi:RHS repeat-associated protein
LTYDPQNGLLTGTSLDNTTDSRSYNQFAELTGYSATGNSTPLYATQYGHDALGRIVTKTETVTSVTTSYAYSYDAAGRLETVQTNGVVTEQYSYDQNGNRLTALGGVTASYDDQDRLLSYGGNSYSYTANGELLSKSNAGGATDYSYDVLGNLMGVILPDGRNITYLVDGQNRRIGKRVNGALERGWLYKDDLNPVAELDSAGNVATMFAYAGKAHVPDYMFKSGTRYRFITDHLGSVRLVVNSSTGAVAQRLDYDAFGRVLLDTNPGFQPFGFAGGLYDPDTGLVRFGARDYDAEAGRWTAKDPIGFAGGDANLYGYVGNDPVNFVDVTGYWVNFVISAAVWGVRAAAGYLSSGVARSVLTSVAVEGGFQAATGDFSAVRLGAAAFSGGLVSRMTPNGLGLVGKIGIDFYVGTLTDLGVNTFENGPKSTSCQIGNIIEGNAAGAIGSQLIKKGFGHYGEGILFDYTLDIIRKYYKKTIKDSVN